MVLEEAFSRFFVSHSSALLWLLQLLQTGRGRPKETPALAFLCLFRCVGLAAQLGALLATQLTGAGSPRAGKCGASSPGVPQPGPFGPLFLTLLSSSLRCLCDARWARPAVQRVPACVSGDGVRESLTAEQLLGPR